MADNNIQDNYYNYTVKEEEKGFDYKQLWVVLLKYKWWFLISIIFCVGAAFVYLRYAKITYSVASKVLIKEKDRVRTNSSMAAALSEMGMKNSSDGFDNEMEVLGTKLLNKKVVRDLKLYANYFEVGKIKDEEIYSKDSPYLVDVECRNLDSLQSVVRVDLEQNGSNVTATVTYMNASMTKALTGFPSRINASFGTVVIERNPLVLSAQLSRNMYVNVNPLDRVAGKYASGIAVEPSSKTTTIAVLKMLDNLPQRSADYLTHLIEVYNNDANEDNNEQARRTADFIDERLGEVSKELSSTEQELAQYKRNAGIVDYESDASLSLAQNSKYEAEVVTVSTQLNLVNSLNDYANDSHNRLQVMPTNIGLTDATLTQTINKYNEAVLERNRLLRTAADGSPLVATATSEAEGYLTAIRASLQSLRRQLEIQRNSLQAQQNKFSGKISSSPSKELVLADISRQREVKSGLYLMLLQKREENAISLASNAFKAKVIEEPIISGPVSPRKSIILIVALVIGIVLPYAFYFIREKFRFRISGIEDIANLTNITVLGTIPFVKALAKGNRAVVVQENRSSVMVEVYRSLRSNLPFVLKPGQNVIMFTSTTSGEGKTTIASNLAASIAFVGKKVVIVGLDIRKPKLAQLFNLDDTKNGISDFLSRSADDFDYLDACIQHTDISPNIDIIPAGTVPPNPAELLERENLGSAIKHLKSIYDYVILDTAPIGLVADTLTIGKHADLTLFVVRANYTLKSDINFVNGLAIDGRLKNVNLVLNGSTVSSGGYGSNRYGAYNYRRNSGSYGYTGYGYGSYGYGYGYGEEKGKKLEEI